MEIFQNICLFHSFDSLRNIDYIIDTDDHLLINKQLELVLF